MTAHPMLQQAALILLVLFLSISSQSPLRLAHAATPDINGDNDNNDGRYNTADKLAALQRIIAHHHHDDYNDDDDDDENEEDHKDDVSSTGYSNEMLLQDLQLLLDNKDVPVQLLDELVEDIQALKEEPVCEADESMYSESGHRDRQDHSEQPDPKEYVDRHIMSMMEAAEDYDCMEREFDLQDPEYDASEAAHVLSKCRLLVVRNAFDKNYTLAYKERFSQYLGGLHLNKTSREGRTTHGEGGFMLKRGSKRWELLLPENLADPGLYANEDVMDVLRTNTVLGEDLSVHSMGAVLSDAGATAGDWHYDDSYVFGGEDAFETSGLGGHDLPPFCATMMVAITDVQFHQGPTEFCVGTSHLRGFDPESDDLPLYDETLEEPDSPFDQLRWHLDKNSCPPGQWRTPLLNVGDAIFFDYQITHRGGQNSSPNLRPMVYVTYSRPWYRDSNFDSSHFHGDENDALVAGARFSLPDRQEECHDSECVDITSIKDFAHDHHSQGAAYGDQEEPDTSAQEFVLANQDIEEAHVYIDDEFVMTLEEYSSTMVTAGVGALLSLRDEDENVLDEWTIVPNQRLIMLHSGLLE